MTSPNQQQQVSQNYISMIGTSLDGVYTWNPVIPEYSQSGAWTATVCVSDSAANSMCYRTYNFQSAGIDNSVNVVSDQDIAPPVVQTLSFTPSPVDVTSGTGDVTASAEITDDVSGTTTVQIFLTSPNQQQQLSGIYQSTAGTPLDAVYTWDIPIPQTAQTGTWTAMICVNDQANNRNCNRTNYFQSAGIDNTVSVTSNQDTVCYTCLLTGGEAEEVLVEESRIAELRCGEPDEFGHGACYRGTAVFPGPAVAFGDGRFGE